MPVVHRKRGKDDEDIPKTRDEQDHEKSGGTGGQKVERAGKAPKKSRAKDIEGVSVMPRIIAAVLIIGVFVYVRDLFLESYMIPEQGVLTFVSVEDSVSRKFMNVKCSSDYGVRFKDCAPKKCGRVVMDDVVSFEEAVYLAELAKRGMKHGGSSGGPTILDLHSGALTYGKKFVNIYKISKQSKNGELFTKKDFEVYKRVKDKIQSAIATEFGIARNKLYLTKPTFFSRMTEKPAKTLHDEYWHPHVDKTTYGSFYYTSLLYLSDYGQNFTGGRFVFVDKQTNHTVEPKTARVSFFTSGSENLHHVEKVTNGTRFAITVSFTCDKKFAISDPKEAS